MSFHTHLKLARASNLPTVWSNVTCAFLLTGGILWPSFWGALLAVSFFYIGGMYLNDWRDAGHDSAHRPERPIPSHAISKKTVLNWVFGYFIAGAAVSLAIEPGSIGWMLGLIACIIAYDLHHKENPLSPWLMAGCRGLIYPWAATLAGASIPLEVWAACAAATLFTLGLTVIARGPAKSIVFKGLTCACVAYPAILWGAYLFLETSFFGIATMAGFLIWTGYSLKGWWQSPPDIGFTVRNLIAGFFLVDLLALAVIGAVTTPIVLILVVLFIATLKIQTIISGT